ncbi:DUF1015 domain-containing protein [Rhodopirellula sp. JC740]|uniref:DUF1015 domain-containing protein n=1 Tax=Rhodopirellula halodulae TaxID=2894198 RepID=A0ABS8NBU8_9BACT|nr:DUF1015 domain-containing protein [Rhodopirellula sp. JC740]MCC9640899.1 DUF1015 domain-containing protein [Rhodopirellula sp. JC740]
MPKVTPFAAVRYNLEHIRSLSEVVAPPYDVIDPDLQDQLYKRHPSNVIRVILNREELGDELDETYHRAGAFVEQWLRQGVLVHDSVPAFYLYHQTFEVDSDGKTQKLTSRGFLGRVRLESFGTGSVHAHEETHAKAKADRLKLMQATRQNNSSIFGLYEDAEQSVIDKLESAKSGDPIMEATDELGVLHQVWAVTDAAAIDEVSRSLSDKSMFVADGHHRYETACAYRDFNAEQAGGLDEDHPANYVMTMLVGMNDPGMVVLPTHRLLRGKSFRADELVDALGSLFECEQLTGGVTAAQDAWTRMRLSGDQSLMALYASEDETWVMAHANEAARARMSEMSADRSETWRGLGVSLLHRLVLEECLSIGSSTRPTYVHDVAEVVKGLRGEGTLAESEGESRYTLAALVMPATLDHVRAISLEGERMPAKSTYFYPKLLSGLAFHRLEPSE